MLIDEDRVTEAIELHKQRCAAFGTMTAEKIRAATNCQFSLLPHGELARMASGWYDASLQAMLNSNHASINTWTRAQAQLAAGENFALADLLELLLICRSAAIQGEKWNEDIFSVVDDAINEALRSIGTAVSWNVPSSLNYLSANSPANVKKPGPGAQPRTTSNTAVLEQTEESLKPWSGAWSDDRRDFGRNRLKVPIRVRDAAGGSVDELAHSENVSRSGLYFLTRSSSYKLQMALKVTYPYWTEPGAINQEYRAKVLRLDRMVDGSFGVAVEFTESLGPRP
jgi:hypothetical protein